MFITQSRHNRNAVGVRHGFDMVDGEGLGIVVTQTTRFDPTRMRQRFIYWLELAADEMAKQVRVQLKEAGFDIDENPGVIIAGRAVSGREYYKQKAIALMPFDEMSTKIRSVVANWAIAGGPKKKSALETYGMMAATMYLSYVMPWVMLSYTLYSMFGKKKKKPRMGIPWDDIYTKALPFAQESVVTEESNKIIEEAQQTQQLRTETMEKRSQEAVLFKLPEGITAIRRGALVMALKGGPVEKRLDMQK